MPFSRRLHYHLPSLLRRYIQGYIYLFHKSFLPQTFPAYRT